MFRKDWNVGKVLEPDDSDMVHRPAISASPRNLIKMQSLGLGIQLSW